MLDLANQMLASLSIGRANVIEGSKNAIMSSSSPIPASIKALPDLTTTSTSIATNTTSTSTTNSVSATPSTNKSNRLDDVEDVTFLKDSGSKNRDNNLSPSRSNHSRLTALHSNQSHKDEPRERISLKSKQCQSDLQDLSKANANVHHEDFRQKQLSSQHQTSHQRQQNEDNQTHQLQLQQRQLTSPLKQSISILANSSPNSVANSSFDLVCGDLRLDTRSHVVGELYDTERSYVESLQILVEKYMKPLKTIESNRLLIESSLVDEIFYTIPEILQHHETFLSALQDRLSSDRDTNQNIGVVFIEAFTNQEIIDTYTAFINNWKNARQAIKIATHAKPAFEKFLEAMSREHRNKLTLDALLIMPVQRIPRYELLIKELIKHTPEDHPDYSSLIEAQKKIHELALKIDRAEKEMIHQEQLKDLEALIEGHVELQHPQRDFIRYDLVTIVSASALTATKKERVLFLFCDLLMMTSIKKKASRRSNLQNAFANSSNDLSLLEGNKFKLLLRVPLEQIEIALDYDQIQIHRQQQRQQQQMHLQRQSKIIQEKRQELEVDLQILQQIELLQSNLTYECRSKLGDIVNATLVETRQKLAGLEQNNIRMLVDEQSPNILSQNSSAPDLYLTPSSSSISTSSNPQTTQSNVTNSQLSPFSNSSTSSQQDSNTSLEFLISNSLSSNSVRESSDIFASDNQGYLTAGSNVAAANSENSQSGQTESLVVTFSCVERRQAFIQAFIEAKQQRYQIQKQQRQQQSKIFSSSVTVKLGPPSTPEKRAPLANSQQEIMNTYLSGPKMIQPSVESPARPIQHSSCSGVEHQLSAPQSLISTGVENWAASQCPSCSYNLLAENEKVQLRHHNRCHHHQIMNHQGSQPVSLDTICCHDPHNDWDHSRPSSELSRTDTKLDNPKSSQQQYRDYCRNISKQIGLNSIVNLSSDISEHESLIEGFDKLKEGQQDQLIDQMNRNIILSECAPKFIVSLPVDFLHTRHPALQFTCSAPGRKTTGSNKIFKTMKDKSQYIEDNLGQLWLCMSNGYVSHIALITIRKKGLKVLNNSHKEFCGYNQPLKNCYNIAPIVISAGDICKSHINCAAQVKWRRAREFPFKNDESKLSTKQDCDTNLGNNPATEVDETSKSPSIDIHQSDTLRKDRSKVRLSESAPSPTSPVEVVKSVNACSSASKLEISEHSKIKDPRLINQPKAGHIATPGKRSIHDQICQRHYHHNSNRQLQNRAGTLSVGSAPHIYQSNPKFQHSHYYHHHHHYNHHYSIQNTQQALHSRAYQNYRSGTGHHHNHSHQHHSHHQSVLHHTYGSRHNTVPIADLRKALMRQNKISQQQANINLKYNNPSTRADDSNLKKSELNSLDLAEQRASARGSRPTTPTPFGGSIKGFRSARLLRHQASLKTSSILAKLVGGASRRSIYLRRSNPGNEKSSDLEDNDTDNESVIPPLNVSSQDEAIKDTTENQTIDSSITPLTTSGSKKQTVQKSNSHLDPFSTNNAPVISPLSSVSSLTSTNSSFTFNSACASSPNRSSSEQLAHSYSTTCCIRSMTPPNEEVSPEIKTEIYGHRSRSATAPSRPVCEQYLDARMGSADYALSHNRGYATPDGESAGKQYKISEITNDLVGSSNKSSISEQDGQHDRTMKPSSLWIGCDDGSLIIIDCLTADNMEKEDIDAIGDLGQRTFTCGNVHSEIKLNSAICDITTFKDEKVFVALSNGQLAIFSRNQTDIKTEKEIDTWSVTNPEIITVTENELNSISRLCLVNETYIWYSYGRNIFVLDIVTLKLETTIMAPTNDPSLRLTVQAVTIDNMELVNNLSGIWVSFKNSHLIQFYDIKSYKLLVEMNLFDPINKLLSYGNEIIRQHKTACLKATSLLNHYSMKEKSNTLFIGTSAGIILYLNISNEQLMPRDPVVEWKPQIASLRHGHSGHVKLLRLITLDSDDSDDDETNLSILNPDEETNRSTDENNNIIESKKNLYLISGGTGLDLYGPNGEQQNLINQLNSDEDSMNHLMIWQL